MTITKPDLLLYLIHQNDIDSKRNNKVPIEQVSRSLNVQPPTIKVYLSNLDHQDLKNRKKKRYVEFFLDTIQITSKGKNLVEDTIVDELEKIHFTEATGSCGAELYHRLSQGYYIWLQGNHGYLISDRIKFVDQATSPRG